MPLDIQGGVMPLATQGDISTGIVSSRNGARAVTNNGTPIVNPGEEVDTNMFLKLLVAQMTNQDPFAQDQDPTKYVTQLAQFAQLEQMQKFNAGLETVAMISNGLLVNSALTASTALMGKEAEFYSMEEGAKPDDTVKGIVESVYIENGSVFLELKVEGSEELKSVRYDTLIKVH